MSIVGEAKIMQSSKQKLIITNKKLAHIKKFNH